MKRRLIAIAGWLAFGVLCALCESVLLRWAAARDVSTALLASGGRLPLVDLGLAAAAMLMRLFTRLLVPGLVLQSLVRPKPVPCAASVTQPSTAVDGL